MRNSPPAIAASPPARIARWRLELVVISELWNPGSEPGAIAAAANQKHRAEAIRRRRIQHVVDSKIAVRFERNASSGGAALDKGSRGFTDQCREDALDGILTDAVAAAKEQAATSARRSAILQMAVEDLTPLTKFRVTFWNVPSAFSGAAKLDTGWTPMPPSNLARESRPFALT